MAGIVYLAWVLACWLAKTNAAMLRSAIDAGADASAATRAFEGAFTTWAAAFDVLGPVWMCLSLWLVIRASRQRRIISWSWLLITCQAIAAILVAIATAGASRGHAMTGWEGSSLAYWSPVTVGIAIFIWVATLVWLILERARYGRRGPAVHDGLKTHFYRR